MSKVIDFCKFYKGEILTASSILFGAAAVGAAFVESPKCHMRLEENKETYRKIRSANPDAKKLDKEATKHIAKTAGNVVYDMKFTLGFEALSIICACVGCRSMRKTITATTALATTALSTLAMTESSVESIFGEEGLRKVKAARMQPIKKVKEVVNSETGEIEKQEYFESPDLSCLDYNAWEILRRQSPEVQAAHDPLSCVVIDDRNSTYRSCGGNIELMLPALRNALNQSNHTMWMDGKIYLINELENLGFMDLHDSSFNRNLMEMLGTIDCPTAYDMVSKQTVNIKGFDSNGIATERGDYGEFTHKSLSFGVDQDKYLFGIPEHAEDAYFVIDGKLFLDLSYDGNIKQYLIGNVSPNRKMTAWHEEPWCEK